MRDKQWSFSKSVVAGTTVIFITVLIACLMRPYDGYDASTVPVAALTAAGSAWLTSIVWYLKKAQAENIPKIKTAYFEDTMRIRLKYNERMMQLKQKYRMTDTDVTDIEAGSPLSEASDSAYQSGVNALDQAEQEADEPASEQTIST